jgi:hypothetical protein
VGGGAGFVTGQLTYRLKITDADGIDTDANDVFKTVFDFWTKYLSEQNIE